MKDTDNIDAASTAPATMDALPFADQFLVWSVRVWAHSNNPEGTDPSYYYRQLHKAFGMAGLGDTHLVFDRFMTMFTSSLRKSLSFHAPNCSCLSHEELFFVCLVADMQNDMVPRAIGNLESYLTATGVRVTMDALSELCRDFAREGIVLQQVPGFEPEEDKYRAPVANRDSAPATVH